MLNNSQDRQTSDQWANGTGLRLLELMQNRSEGTIPTEIAETAASLHTVPKLWGKYRKKKGRTEIWGQVTRYSWSDPTVCCQKRAVLPTALPCFPVFSLVPSLPSPLEVIWLHSKYIPLINLAEKHPTFPFWLIFELNQFSTGSENQRLKVERQRFGRAKARYPFQRLQAVRSLHTDTYVLGTRTCCYPDCLLPERFSQNTPLCTPRNSLGLILALICPYK